jgi:hypothetical protein
LHYYRLQPIHLLLWAPLVVCSWGILHLHSRFLTCRNIDLNTNLNFVMLICR